MVTGIHSKVTNFIIQKRTTMKFCQIALLSALSFLVFSCAQAEHSLPMLEDNTQYKTKLLWPEINVPWGMAQLPDGRILVTERAGELWLVSQGKPSVKISGLPDIHANRQGGLLDIALHPNFTKNNLLFFTYSTDAGEGSNTALMRAELDVKNNQLINNKILYKGEGSSNSGTHYGSRIVISGEHVYFSMGDRGRRNTNPQRLDLDGGKIYRLNLDGSIPSSNPFYTKDLAKKAIFSYGHRNPQGLIVIPDNGSIWSHEHGPKGGDEVNLIKAGENYGWPIISYGVNYSGSKFTELTKKAGMQQPKLYWVPSIAPSGMAYITSNKYPQWQGKVLLGSMKFAHAVLLEITNETIVKQTKLLADVGGRVRSIIQGTDGYIYLGIDGKGVLRIEPH